MSDVISSLTKEVNAALSTATGQNSVLQVSVRSLHALLTTVRNQEKEIIGWERYSSSIEERVAECEESLAFTDLEEEEPGEDGLYECFVGDDLADENAGRLFAMFDSSTGIFSADGQELNNVLLWRHTLPEPGEMLDILGDLDAPE